MMLMMVKAQVIVKGCSARVLWVTGMCDEVVYLLFYCSLAWFSLHGSDFSADEGTGGKNIVGFRREYEGEIELGCDVKQDQRASE